MCVNPRDTIKLMFEDILKLHESTLNVADVATKLERGCFNATIESCTADGIDRLMTEPKFLSRYSAYAAKIAANIDPAIGTHAVNLLINGANPHSFARMSSIDLCPEASEVVRDNIATRLNIKVERKVSTLYQCGMCKCWKTTYIEYQARSSDEPSTRSFTCTNCPHSWRN